MQNAQDMVQISMMAKPTNLADSVILYNGQDDAGQGDYISIALNNGYIEFKFDSGSGIIDQFPSLFIFIKTNFCILMP